MSSAGPEARKRAEAIWQEKLRQAENRYRLAAAHTRQLQSEFADASMPGPDGSFALQSALRFENQARIEYMRVLHLFTELILHGELPDKNQHHAG